MDALFADDQVIIDDSEEFLQRAIHQLPLINKQYNFYMDTKTKGIMSQ